MKNVHIHHPGQSNYCLKSLENGLGFYNLCSNSQILGFCFLKPKKTWNKKYSIKAEKLIFEVASIYK